MSLIDSLISWAIKITTGKKIGIFSPLSANNNVLNPNSAKFEGTTEYSDKYVKYLRKCNGNY